MQHFTRAQINQTLTIVCFVQTNWSLVVAWSFVAIKFSVANLSFFYSDDAYELSIHCETKIMRIQCCQLWRRKDACEIQSFAQTTRTKPNITILSEILIISNTMDEPSVLETNQTILISSTCMQVHVCVSIVNSDGYLPCVWILFSKYFYIR